VSADEYFVVATWSDRVGTWIFWGVTGLSALLLFVPKPKLEVIAQPILIVAMVSGIVAAILTTIFQTNGNRLLRASQLSASLGGSIGDPIRADYYNNALPNSLARLAATTLENTLHTGRVLTRMLWTERTTTVVYLLFFVLLMAYRSTSLSWLLLFTQTLFSAEVVLRWLRMERFQFRTMRVHEQLRQFFLQGGKVRSPNGTAIALAAFTDYECAKDEAALPLDSRIFRQKNANTSGEWERIKAALNLE
jgi:hypothetical protein